MYGWSKTDHLVSVGIGIPLRRLVKNCSGKEIAGLLKMKGKNDDTKTMKSRVSGFSHAKLEAGRHGLGLCIVRDESKSCCCVFSGPS